jgi:TatA/E family protein of Tat protein translocase
MPQIGPAEIVVVLLVALLVFGPHKLPEVGRQVGRGLRELRKLQDAVKGEIDQVMHAADVQPQPVEPPAPLPAPAPIPRAAGNGTDTAPASDAPPAGPTAGPARPAHAPSRFRAPRRTT